MSPLSYVDFACCDLYSQIYQLISKSILKERMCFYKLLRDDDDNDDDDDDNNKKNNNNNWWRRSKMFFVIFEPPGLFPVKKT